MEIIKVPDNKVKLFYKELWPLIPEDKWEKEDCINFNLKDTELICKFYNIDFNIDEYTATKYGDYCVMSLTQGPTYQKSEGLIFRQIMRPCFPYDDLELDEIFPND